MSLLGNTPTEIYTTGKELTISEQYKHLNVTQWMIKSITVLARYCAANTLKRVEFNKRLKKLEIQINNEMGH